MWSPPSPTSQVCKSTATTWWLTPGDEGGPEGQEEGGSSPGPAQALGWWIVTGLPSWLSSLSLGWPLLHLGHRPFTNDEGTCLEVLLQPSAPSSLHLKAAGWAGVLEPKEGVPGLLRNLSKPEGVDGTLRLP